MLNEIPLDLDWSAPKPTTYKDRPAVVRVAPLPYKAPASEQFWALYRARKNDLVRAGYSVRRDDRGAWSVAHFSAHVETAEERAAKEAARELSRATDADVAIPCPSGLTYLPYQKAGIAFALRVFGDL